MYLVCAGITLIESLCTTVTLKGVPLPVDRQEVDLDGALEQLCVCWRKCTHVLMVYISSTHQETNTCV